jgi:hypothetical protein
MPRLPHKKYATLHAKYCDAISRAVEMHDAMQRLVEEACPHGISRKEWEFAVDHSLNGDEIIFREPANSLNLAMIRANESLPDETN